MSGAITLKERAIQYALLMRLDRPIGIFLLLWPTLWALWIAGEGHPDKFILIIFILGVIVMRSAGCVINDFADRDIDRYIARTRERPLAAGRIKPKEAIMLFLILSLVGIFLVSLMNRITIYLSLVAFVLAVSYPFVKRYTHLPQVHLGLAFSWSIPMAFAAQTGSVPRVAWLLLIATVLWTTAFDTIYAMMDRKDDIRIGVKSTAILFGNADRYFVGVIQLSMLFVMILIGQELQFTEIYYAGLIIAAGYAIYQQILLRERQTLLYFKAFMLNNWFGIAIFAGISLHYV